LPLQEIYVCIVQAAPILISSIVHNLTLAMSPPACVQFERGTIRMCRHEAALISSKGLVTVLTSVALGQVEFILMGGTFMSLPTDYRDYFIRNLHDALSGHSSHDVQEAVQYSEHGAVKCIGLTIETRPDYCLAPHLRQMLTYGCTRLEIGVQSTYEDVARDTNRGHTVAAVADCFCLAKDAGFKVSYLVDPDVLAFFFN
jgi:hypothetical protein